VCNRKIKTRGRTVDGTKKHGKLLGKDYRMTKLPPKIGGGTRREEVGRVEKGG